MCQLSVMTKFFSLSKNIFYLIFCSCLCVKSVALIMIRMKISHHVFILFVIVACVLISSKPLFKGCAITSASATVR